MNFWNVVCYFVLVGESFFEFLIDMSGMVNDIVVSVLVLVFVDGFFFMVLECLF